MTLIGYPRVTAPHNWQTATHRSVSMWCDKSAMRAGTRRRGEEMESVMRRLLGAERDFDLDPSKSDSGVVANLA